MLIPPVGKGQVLLPISHLSRVLYLLYTSQCTSNYYDKFFITIYYHSKRWLNAHLKRAERMWGEWWVRMIG